MKNKFAVIYQLFLFGIVGVVGFIVDAGILHITKDIIGLYFGRGISFICAVLATWLLNRTITFKVENRTSLGKELLYYIGCMLFGGVVNLVVYYVLIENYLLIQQQPIIGVAIGSIAGMMINFISSKWLVFKKK